MDFEFGEDEERTEREKQSRQRQPKAELRDPREMGLIGQLSGSLLWGGNKRKRVEMDAERENRMREKRLEEEARRRERLEEEARRRERQRAREAELLLEAQEKSSVARMEDELRENTMRARERFLEARMREVEALLEKDTNRWREERKETVRIRREKARYVEERSRGEVKEMKEWRREEELLRRSLSDLTMRGTHRLADMGVASVGPSTIPDTEQHFGNAMELILHRVMQALRRSSMAENAEDGDFHVSFRTSWDPTAFLEDQYPSGRMQPIRHTLALTGEAVNAQITTVERYLAQNWPEHTYSLIDCQLAWLGATCRASTGQLALCYTTFSEVNYEQADFPNIGFCIAYEVSSVGLESVESCWHDLVGNSVIAAGFPTPERVNGEVGLHIPFQIMAALASVPLATQFCGGYVLKGRSIMLIPVKRKAGVQFALSRKDGYYHSRKSDWYRDMLDDAAQISVVLQDMEDRRAWLADAETMILHMIIHRDATQSSKGRGPTTVLQTCAQENAMSVREAMLSNCDVAIRRDRKFDDDAAADKLFKDLVNELFTVLEGLQSVQKELSRESGKEMKLDESNRLYGWEYLDIVNRKRHSQLRGT
ncbi:hypothetical protein EJ04DRAFT_582469 [Polyplosphaeria fusca]|uniref:Uncharacterized protein n=1 Tax=Polyplosphaeria fusca TaxID=682080 RepID=A0A9P4QGD4_9PLEO|nr:hypothetical protein EJ04DRAFT_582469 [Polyplosphaeria fusca]